MAVVIRDQEKALLQEFRKVTEDLDQDFDDITMLRFLRARNLDLMKAEAMFRKTVSWRLEKKIESISNWIPPALVVNDFKLYSTGTDSDGRPVYFAPIGSWDGRKVLGQGYKEASLKFMYKTVELILKQVRQNGAFQFNVIIDNAGLSFRKVAHWETIETLVVAMTEFEANYPEQLHKAILINTPYVFNQGFKFVKPVLGENTISKIVIMDSDKNKYKAELLKSFSKTGVPIEFGGSVTPTLLFKEDEGSSSDSSNSDSESDA